MHRTRSLAARLALEHRTQFLDTIKWCQANTLITDDAEAAPINYVWLVIQSKIYHTKAIQEKDTIGVYASKRLAILAATGMNVIK